jgi:hypothetical protein
MTKTLGQQEGMELRVWQHSLVFLAACLLLFTRRPDAIVHAQFYAEAGHVWFADAYNLGWWNALFRAQDGYFQTFSRLGAALALLAPFAQTPLVLNIIAIAAQALPVNLLTASRSAGWGSLRLRALLAVIYLALPNYGEVSFGITESQWLLALSVFLLLVARAPQGWLGRCFDLVLVLLSGLSGPFCIFLLPIAVFAALKRRARWPWAPAGVLAMCVTIQAYALLVIDRTGRAHPPLGASPALLARILGGNVILGAILGRIPFATMPGEGIFIVLLCAAAVGTLIASSCFFRPGIEMKLFLALAGMIFVAALLFPVTNPPAGSTVWQMLAKAFAVRYWVFPSLAFAWSLVWCARQGNVVLRAASVMLLCAMCLGALINWIEPPQRDLHFAEYAASFEAAPAGTVITIPESPKGWTIRLIKHASR